MKHDNKTCKVQFCIKDYLRHIAIAVGGGSRDQTHGGKKKEGNLKIK